MHDQRNPAWRDRSCENRDTTNWSEKSVPTKTQWSPGILRKILSHLQFHLDPYNNTLCDDVLGRSRHQGLKKISVLHKITEWGMRELVRNLPLPMLFSLHDTNLFGGFLPSKLSQDPGQTLSAPKISLLELEQGNVLCTKAVRGEDPEQVPLDYPYL